MHSHIFLHSPDLLGHDDRFVIHRFSRPIFSHAFSWYSQVNTPIKTRNNRFISDSIDENIRINKYILVININP